jgi:acyl-coenzyme A synthetase/AMP-(fatty) acid ligase
MLLQGVIRGVDIGNKLRSNKNTTLLSVIPRRRTEHGPSFLCSIDGRLPITHFQTYQFILEFGATLHGLGIGRGHRVALVIPNGVELALGILAVSQWATCVPLSSNSAASELKADLERCGADLVIGPYAAGALPTEASSIDASARPASGNVATEMQGLAQKLAVMESSPSDRDWTVHHHVQEIAMELNIPFAGLVPSPYDATFRLWLPPPPDGKKTKTRTTLRVHQDVPLDYSALPTVHGIRLVETNPTGEDEKLRRNPNMGLDEALVLFTSGTTGNKKLVPHCLGDILTAAVTIALSWELDSSDVNCNLMPLFHVGGIIRYVTRQREVDIDQQGIYLFIF